MTLDTDTGTECGAAHPENGQHARSRGIINDKGVADPVRGHPHAAGGASSRRHPHVWKEHVAGAQEVVHLVALGGLPPRMPALWRAAQLPSAAQRI